jgi:hypothetical protein
MASVPIAAAADMPQANITLHWYCFHPLRCSFAVAKVTHPGLKFHAPIAYYGSWRSSKYLTSSKRTSARKRSWLIPRCVTSIYWEKSPVVTIEVPGRMQPLILAESAAIVEYL